VNNPDGTPLPTVGPKKSLNSCWLFGGIGCLAVVLLALLALGIGVNKVMHTASGKQLMDVPDCAQKMSEIQAALVRYQLKNGRYPQTLNQLNPDYLPSNSVLHTPLDTNHDPSHVSFTYYQPAPNAPPSTKVLCLQWHYAAAYPGQVKDQEELFTTYLDGHQVVEFLSNGKLLYEQSYAAQ
jgi:hypothetical protein